MFLSLHIFSLNLRGKTPLAIFQENYLMLQQSFQVLYHSKLKRSEPTLINFTKSFRLKTDKIKKLCSQKDLVSFAYHLFILFVLEVFYKLSIIILLLNLKTHLN
jgi:hypothetical protein